MEIVTGKKSVPVKGILYGVEGIGKTTMAAKWPKPLFLDVENGSWQMDVARVVPGSYAEFKDCIRQLIADSMGYQTLVIDSADWLETMMIKHICTEANITSIEKYEKGYGKGWNKLAEDWAALLDRLDMIRTRQGMNILFVAHSRIKRYEPADDTGHDRYTLTLAEKSADVLKKWSDLTLFVKYDTWTVDEGGKVKVKGGDKRVMYSKFHPCWDAKNRYGLPDKMPFEFEQIAGIFQRDPEPETDPEQTPPKPAEKSPETAQQAQKAPDAGTVSPQPETAADEPPKTPEQAELLEKIDGLIRQSGIGYGDLAGELERKGVVPTGTPIRNYNLQTLNRIIAGWSAIVHNINMKKKGK